MRCISLASGSKGNCHAFAVEHSILLVDAGLSLLQIRQRLQSVGLHADHVMGIALTHEHSDHINALPVILKRTNWKILATAATLQAICAARGVEIPAARWIPLQAGHALEWEGWRVQPFAIPHDAVDPVGYRLERNGFAAGVVTDLGHPTALVADYCADLDHLVLEANHDVHMLREGSYTPQLKARILSRVGHLSNEAAAELLARVWSKRLATVVLAHLSEQNNLPDLARFAVQQSLTGSGTRLLVASQKAPLDVEKALCPVSDGMMDSGTGIYP